MSKPLLSCQKAYDSYFAGCNSQGNFNFSGDSELSNQALSPTGGAIASFPLLFYFSVGIVWAGKAMIVSIAIGR